MKALTVCQPWAWAIVHGPKRVENRTWGTPYRGPLLIHAGKSCNWLVPTLNDGTRVPVGALYFGAAVGVAHLAACVNLSAYRRGAITSLPDAVREALDTPFAEGPYCWVLADVRALPEPIPLAGLMGLWDVPPDVLLGVERQLRAEGVPS